MGLAREVLEALAAAPDGEFVRVEQRDEQVVIAKEGRFFKVQRHRPARERLRQRAAAAGAQRAARRRTAASAPRRSRARSSGVRFTDLVDVRNGNDHVRVWVW